MPPKKCQDRKHNIFLVPDTKPKRTRKPNVAKMVECGPQEKSVQGDDPLALSSGTEVSAKYKGAFCEARISKVVRTVKCKVTFKNGLGTTTVLDTDIKGTVKAGSLVEANHPTSKQFGEAIINKITDASQYTVVFDDGDITTLRRSALCLKSGRHFNESETLDQLPLTHPEHFGNPVIGARGRGRRSKPTLDESDCEDDSQLQLQDDDDNSRSNNDSNFPNKEDKEIQSETGKVVWVETLEKQTKKKDGWFPGVIVAPSAQTSIKYDHDIEYLVRSFKDARYYSVPKDEVGDFNKTLYDNDKLSAATKIAIDKAWLFLEQKELPPHWDKHSIFGDSAASENDDTETDRQDDKSDEETLQQNDLFIAHLYKFMDDCNTPLDRYPEIEGEEVNFYKLYNIVGKLGGHAKVTASNLWKKVTRNLRLRAGYGENACSQVKSVYKKYLANFEDIRKKLGCTMLLQAGTSTSTRGVGRKQKSTRGLGKDKDRSTPPQTEKTLVKSEKDDEEKDKKPSQSIEEEKKRDAKKETLIKDEDAPLSKIKKKEQMDDSASGGDSDINNEGEESSCSEKSQKSMSRLTPCSTISNRSRTSRDTKETKRKLSQDKKKSETSKRQDKKEDKSKEEDNTKTRSKITKDDPHSKLQKTNTEARESRISTCDTDKKTLAGKQKKFTDEELKKRGRKKKEVETGKNLLSADEDLTQHYKGPVAMGDRLKVIYGPNQDQKITYEAKVVDIECNNPDNNPSYLVHYTGWNTRYDEWIKIDRIALNYSQQGSGRSKKPNKDKNTSQIRPQTPGSTPRTSKVSASANTSSLPGMSSRRRIQNDSSASNSNKDSRKDDREITLATTRSGTPSPLISRTKSPASTGRPTRMTRNLTEVSEGRGSRKRLETDDSDSSDSDGSDSPVIPIKPRRRNCETREARKRAESRMKVDENSDIDEDKEIEEPRRGRRSRRTATKMTEIKSEPESETEQPKGCEFDLNQIRSELKGFDKAVKIEMSSTSTSQEQEEHAEEKTSIIVKEEKSELDEKKVSLDDDNKMSDKQETSTLPIKKDVVNTEAIPESTEDIYEFKEPEPFEFEVRNKRDSSGSDKTEKDSNKDLKDKSTAAPPASIVKKRPAEDDLKSPKKRLKTPASSSQLVAAATATKDSKADINRSTTPIETVVSADAKKKTTRKIFSKSDDTESTEGEESSSLTSLSPTKFYPSTSYPGATVIRRHKMSTDEDLGSSPHETATENIKNKRLLLNKTTSIKNVSDHKSEEQSVDEAKKKSIKPKSLDLDKGNKETKEIPSFYIPAKITETREDEQKTSIKKKMKSQDPPTLLETKKKQAVVRQTPTRKDHLSSGGESDSDIESISTRDPSKYFSQYSGPKTKAAAAIASEYESLNNKVDAQSGDKRIEPVQSIEKSQLNTSTTVTKSSNTEQKSDYTMGTPVSLTVPPPISARLPATATIEEKLSAAAVFHRRQMIESKKEEESKQDRKVAKEMPKKTHGVAFSATKKAEAKITPEPEKKKVEAPLIIPIKDPLQEIEIHTDPLLEIMKSKEEEQLKAKKSMEEQKTTTNVIKTYQRKEPPPKPEESWKKVTSTTVISDQLAAVTSTGRKEPFVSRIKTLERSESVDSTDSSDSERRLTIIDEDYTDETGPEQSKKSNHSEQSSLATSSAQRDLQADIINTMMQTKLVTKLDEDGENINSLLCEEEIPGSPTPGTDSHNEHQERSTSSNSQNIFKSDLGSKAAVAFVAAQLPLTIPSTTSVSTLVSSSLESLNASNGKSITSTASSTPVSVLTTTSTSHLYVTTVVTTTTGSTPPLTHLHQNQRRDSNVEPMEVDVAPVTIDFNTSSIPTQRVPTPALSLDSDSKKDSMEVDIDALNKSENPLTSTENVADDSKIKGAMKRTTSITSADEVENVSPKKRAKRSGVQQTSSSGPIKKSPRQNSKNRKSTTRSDTDDSDNEQVISQLPKAIRDLLTNVTVTPPRKLPDPTDYSKAPPPEFDSNAKIAYFTKQLNLIIKEYGEYKSVNSKVDRIRRKLKKKKSREAQKNKDDNEQPGTSQ